MKKFFLLLLCSSVLISDAQTENLPKFSAGIPINYKEDSVGNYTLPDVLKMNTGQPVKTATDWTAKRRPEILKQIEETQFGKAPGKPKDLHFEVIEKGTPVLQGKAIRKQVRVYFTNDTVHKMDMLIYLPKSNQPVPLLLNISFTPNNITASDSAVAPQMIWTKEGKQLPGGMPQKKGQIDIAAFINAGFGFACIYYQQIEPDTKTGLPYGIRSQYLQTGQTTLSQHEWGAIAAFSWGLSRAMDYFETDKQIDAKRIALQGASRLGKTVLWAGVRDTRFKLVIASVSGEGGAALARRNYGENIAHITDTSRYYYQFAPAYHSYANRVAELPFDAHMLVALMAPRPLLLQTGDTDFWSDPKGEWLSALAAAPVYKLFGKETPTTDAWPAAGDTAQLLHTLGYYMHKGGHGTLPEDWPLFIEYLKKFL